VAGRPEAGLDLALARAPGAGRGGVARRGAQLHAEIAGPIDARIAEAREQRAARVAALETELEQARKALAELDGPSPPAPDPPVERATHVLVQISDPHLVPEGPLPRDRRDPHRFAAAVDAVLAADVRPRRCCSQATSPRPGDAASYRRCGRRPTGSPSGAGGRGQPDDPRARCGEHLLGARTLAPPRWTPSSTWTACVIVVLDSTCRARPRRAAPAQLVVAGRRAGPPAPHGTVLALHHPPLRRPPRSRAVRHCATARRWRRPRRHRRPGSCSRGHTHVTSAGARIADPGVDGRATSKRVCGTGSPLAGTARVVCHARS
jgi:hypothetical protein